MATNLFSRAAAYRKKHPGMSMPEAVKAVSKGSKPAKKKAAKPAKKKRAAPKKTAHKKKATIGRKPRKAAKKKAAAAKVTPRKVKVKIKGGKKGGAVIRVGSTHTANVYKQLKSKGLKLPHGYAVEKRTISGISMGGISHEHTRQASLHNHIKSRQTQLKAKGQLKQAKDAIRREIKQLRDQIAASKRHVTVLKRSI